MSEDLWRDARARLEGAQQVYLRGTNGHLWGRPANGVESKYLLTGLLVCANCGGSLTVTSRHSGRGRHYAYACSYNRFRGTSVCKNGLWSPMERTDDAVLSVLETQLLHPVAVSRAIELALEELRQPADQVCERRAEAETEIRTVEAELGRLTQAVVAGGPMESLVIAIKDREARRGALVREIEGLEGRGRLTAIDVDRLRRDLGARLEDWRGLLRRQPIQARQILRKLVDGRLTFTPAADDEGRYYEFNGRGTLGQVLAGSLSARAMVAPTGFARRWQAGPSRSKVLSRPNEQRSARRPWNMAGFRRALHRDTVATSHFLRSDTRLWLDNRINAVHAKPVNPSHTQG